MNLPDYVTVEEVQRVCRELGLQDWTRLEAATIPPEEAARVLEEINVQQMPIPLKDFKAGLEVELEHGVRFADANVTNNHPLLTGKIVLAHLKETLDYYQRIDIAETEADLFKALCAQDPAKALAKYGKLVAAKIALAQYEATKMT
jgi:hypothetical protein